MKNIIFCADGTWNGPGTQTSTSPIDGADNRGELSDGAATNVVRLFSNLAGHVTPDTMSLRNEQEKLYIDDGRARQIAKYMHGVGDSSNPINRFLGGVFGMGVIARIVRGYTFISRNYVDGDDIHLLGFSRGAYTARALAGMIANVGLLNPQSYDPSNKEDAYRLGFAAWAKSKGVTLQGQPTLVRLGNILIGFVEHFLAKELPQNGLLANIPIKSVAVWDTVGSMGIPVYASDRRNDLFRFVDTKLNERIANGFQAMAIDEMRSDFPITRWDARSGVTQVWFVGAHADVGGGYPAVESRLSDGSLSWIMKKLSDVGVDFVAQPVYVPEPNSVGQAIHEPWTKPPFDHLAQAPRQVQPADLLHQSVVQRWTKDASYRPTAMAVFGSKAPATFNVDATLYA